jgi:hypothetical protein
MKKILLNQGTMQFLKEKLHVSRHAVSDAINFHTKSKLSNTIRKMAIEHGAYYLNDQNNIETIHDESKNQMIQKFGSVAEIKVDKESNLTILFIEGKPLEKIEDCTILQLMELQERAIKIAGGE